jgi:putative transposase
MPRLPRFCPADHPTHVVQRGNNRQVCFTCDGDMAAYAHSLHKGATKYGLAVHAWVFMTNHVHLLMTPSTDQGVSQLMRHMGRHYVQPFNFKYARSGTLFEGRFRSSLVQDHAYLLNCIRYIEFNPVRAGITTDPGDYRWSSYRCHAFGATAGMWTPRPEYLGLGENDTERQKIYRKMMAQSLSAEVIQKIRHCLNTGLVLGTADFRDQVKALRS